MNYVVLLRGINIGGVKMPMADLKASLNQLGLSNLKTYLASGNVSFSSSLDRIGLKKLIENTLSKEFGYIKEIFIYQIEDLIAVIDNYPFEPEKDTHRYVIFSLGTETLNQLGDAVEHLSLTSESVKKGEGVLYWSVKVGQTLDSNIGKLISSSRFKDQLTTRNLQTLDKIKNFVTTL